PAAEVKEKRLKRAHDWREWIKLSGAHTFGNGLFMPPKCRQQESVSTVCLRQIGVEGDRSLGFKFRAGPVPVIPGFNHRKGSVNVGKRLVKFNRLRRRRLGLRKCVFRRYVAVDRQ